MTALMTWALAGNGHKYFCLNVCKIFLSDNNTNTAACHYDFNDCGPWRKDGLDRPQGWETAQHKRWGWHTNSPPSIIQRLLFRLLLDCWGDIHPCCYHLKYFNRSRGSSNDCVTERGTMAHLTISSYSGLKPVIMTIMISLLWITRGMIVISAPSPAVVPGWIVSQGNQ